MNRSGGAGKWLGRIFKTFLVLLAVPVVAVLFFWIQADFRESQTRHEAAPSTGRFVQAGDVELYIQEVGPVEGQAILFVHGTAAWSGLWLESIAPLAAAGYHCIAIDIPPFGFSEKPATPSYGNREQAARIVGLMDALDVESAVLVGHSFGGGATMEAALMIPDRIDGMILLAVGGLNLNPAPVVEGETISLVQRFFGTPALRNPVLATIGTNPLFMKTVFAGMLLDPEDITEHHLQLLQQPLALQGATNTLGEWLNSVLAAQEASLTSDPANYQALTMPVQIIWGVGDTIIPLSDGEYLHSILPDSNMALMDDINHIAYIEEKDAFAEISLEFLQSL
jgi:pimeloyl-ACP methyl ester carboxylesterase